MKRMDLISSVFSAFIFVIGTAFVFIAFWMILSLTIEIIREFEHWVDKKIRNKRERDKIREDYLMRRR